MRPHIMSLQTISILPRSTGMRFTLFSKIEFEVVDPVALIECYCFQSDFFVNFDLLPIRKVEHVNKIGSRIPEKLLRRCRDVINEAGELGIFTYDLDEFLNLNNEGIVNHVGEVSKVVIKKLMEIESIGLSKATKILHTLYPRIIPMIDGMLQGEYQRNVNPWWKEDNPSQILIDYYNNLKEHNNRRQLTQVFDAISKTGLGLTKVRVFDILWWSYVKAKRVKEEAIKRGQSINFSAIKW